MSTILIHRGPSDECPCCHDAAPMDDGTCCPDAYHTPGKASSGRIVTWCFAIGVAMVVAVAIGAAFA